jgi:hypothetical protein
MGLRFPCASCGFGTGTRSFGIFGFFMRGSISRYPDLVHSCRVRSRGAVGLGTRSLSLEIQGMSDPFDIIRTCVGTDQAERLALQISPLSFVISREYCPRTVSQCGGVGKEDGR